MRRLSGYLAKFLFFWMAMWVVGQFVAKRFEGDTDHENEDFRLMAFFGGREVRSKNPAINQSRAIAVFGGINIDLTEAAPGDEAQVELRAYFGGIRLVVPPTWRVLVTSDAKAGEIEIDLPEPEAFADAAPVLRLDASVRFGGVLVTGSA